MPMIRLHQKTREKKSQFIKKSFFIKVDGTIEASRATRYIGCFRLLLTLLCIPPGTTKEGQRVLQWSMIYYVLRVLCLIVHEE